MPESVARQRGSDGEGAGEAVVAAVQPAESGIIGPFMPPANYGSRWQRRRQLPGNHGCTWL